MEAIRTLQQYIDFEMYVWERIYADFDIKPDKNARKMKLTQRFNEKIKPHIDNIGNMIGEKDSVFNPIRKITNVGYLNGELVVTYKEPKQKLERFEKIRL